MVHNTCIIIDRFYSYYSKLPDGMHPNPGQTLTKASEMGKIITDWKTTTVTPIYKKRPKRDTAN